MSTADWDRSLKAMNMKWLVMLAALDILVVIVFLAPEFLKDASWSTVAVMRGLVTALLPVIILLLTGMLSHETKSQLVYWKVANPYPGCEAFTRHGPADIRIDMVSLKNHVGEFPTDPGDQNKKWFKLYTMVGDERAVVDAHRLYLMYRDMAAMSLPLTVLAPIGLHFVDAPSMSLLMTAVLFAAQFVVCCLGARHAGTRLVCNVLSIHSTKKVTDPKPAPAA